MAEYAGEQGRALKKSGKWFLLFIATLLASAVFYGPLGVPFVGGAIALVGFVLFIVGLWKFGSAGGDTTGMAAGFD